MAGKIATVANPAAVMILYRLAPPEAAQTMALNPKP